jgi:hypothetical protein
MSGRGRSGTLGAIIAGTYSGLGTDDLAAGSLFVDENGDTRRNRVVRQSDGRSNLSGLVDLIVRMRSNRDGLVELPEQFHFVRRLLGLI